MGSELASRARQQATGTGKGTRRGGRKGPNGLCLTLERDPFGQDAQRILVAIGRIVAAQVGIGPGLGVAQAEANDLVFVRADDHGGTIVAAADPASVLDPAQNVSCFHAFRMPIPFVT